MPSWCQMHEVQAFATETLRLSWNPPVPSRSWGFEDYMTLCVQRVVGRSIDCDWSESFLLNGTPLSQWHVCAQSLVFTSCISESATPGWSSFHLSRLPQRRKSAGWIRIRPVLGQSCFSNKPQKPKCKHFSITTFRSLGNTGLHLVQDCEISSAFSQ